MKVKNLKKQAPSFVVVVALASGCRIYDVPVRADQPPLPEDQAELISRFISQFQAQLDAVDKDDGQM